MDKQQLLRDSNIEPTMEVIEEGLGATSGSYALFLEELKNYEIQVDWRYYNDGKAWLGKGLHHWVTSRGTKKENTVFWLSIWEGFFKVSVFIPEKHRDDVLDLPLTDEIKTMISNAKQMGKLKFFPLVFDITSNNLFPEIFTLINFRKSLK